MAEEQLVIAESQNTLGDSLPKEEINFFTSPKNCLDYNTDCDSEFCVRVCLTNPKAQPWLNRTLPDNLINFIKFINYLSIV